MSSVEQVVADALRLFESMAFRDALELVERDGLPYAAEEPLLPFMKACAEARLDEPDAAVATLQQAVEAGHWYGEELLDRTRSLETLREHGALAELLALFKERRELETRNDESVLVSGEETAGSPPRPLLLALHGNWDNAASALEEWRGAMPPDWIVAAVSSSVAIAPGRYAWYGGPAVAEVTEAVRCVCELRDVDSARIVLAGISSGADTAIDALLTGLEARGVIAAAVGGGPSAFADGRRRADRRIYFVVGAGDSQGGHEALAQRVAALAQAGVRSIVESVPQLGHRYPDDLSDVAQRATSFLGAAA